MEKKNEIHQLKMDFANAADDEVFIKLFILYKR